MLWPVLELNWEIRRVFIPGDTDVVLQLSLNSRSKGPQTPPETSSLFNINRRLGQEHQDMGMIYRKLI